MRTFDESLIRPDEIDHLGHMNVRFYMERAQRAHRALTAKLGLAETPEARLVQTDSYTRYQREQFEGSTLAVRGGVLEASPERIRTYFELVNEARGEIAATFILAASLIEPATRAARPIPPAALAAAEAAAIALPEHGRPRTIDLKPPRTDVSFDDLARRLTEDEADPMSRRVERVIGPEECDEHGFLADNQDMMFGFFRPPSPEQQKSFGPMTFTSLAGHRLGWASMETRNVRLAQPRAGDRLCSLGAEIGLHGKVRHSRRWVFNTDTGALVALNDNVNVALDLDARRSIEIPPEIRDQLVRRHLPELG